MEDLVLTIPTQDGAFIETLAQRRLHVPPGHRKDPQGLPEDKDALARTLTNDFCRQMIDETKQLQQWIEGHLPATRPSSSSEDTSE